MNTNLEHYNDRYIGKEIKNRYFNIENIKEREIFKRYKYVTGIY